MSYDCQYVLGRQGSTFIATEADSLGKWNCLGKESMATSLLTLAAHLLTLNLLAILLFVYFFTFNLWTFVICSFIAN